jgi:beta-galactosidase
MGERPAPTLAPAEGDNNSWDFLQAGTPTPGGVGGSYRLYTSVFTPRRQVAAQGGIIRFAAIGGRAELWVDGTRIGLKSDAAAGPLEGRLPPGMGPRRIALIVQAESGAPSGLLGRVTVSTLRP